MSTSTRVLLSVSALGLFASCTRAPSESFANQGIRDARVVFVADSSVVEVKDVSPRFKAVTFLRPGETPAVALRAIAGRELTGWGANCGSKYMSKGGSFDVRMGLVRQTDGWNVGNPVVLRNYVKTTGTDFIVLLNKLTITRGDLERAGAGAQGKLGIGDAVMDISVIDAKAGKRVWRSSAQARAERPDSLELIGRDAIRQAVDNFFTSLPESRRWGCTELMDRFK